MSEGHVGEHYSECYRCPLWRADGTASGFCRFLGLSVADLLPGECDGEREDNYEEAE